MPSGAGLGIVASSMRRPTSVVPVSSYLLWLDASDQSTVFSDTSGTTAAVVGTSVVRRWTDKSSSKNHATIAFEDANSAKLLTDGRSGRPILQGKISFTLQNKTFTKTLPAAGVTIFVVYECRSYLTTSKASAQPFNHCTSTHGTGWAASANYPDNIYPIMSEVRAVPCRPRAACTALSGPFGIAPGSSPGLHWLEYDTSLERNLYVVATNSAAGTTQRFMCNNLLDTAVLTPTWNNLDVNLGTNISAIHAAYGLWGALAEIRVIGAVLSADERRAVVAELQTKWAIPDPIVPYAWLMLWLDAADATTLFSDAAGSVPAVVGGPVRRWRDKSYRKSDAYAAATVAAGYAPCVAPTLTVTADGTSALAGPTSLVFDKPRIAATASLSPAMTLVLVLTVDSATSLHPFCVAAANLPWMLDGSGQTQETLGCATRQAASAAGAGLLNQRCVYAVVADSTTARTSTYYDTGGGLTPLVSNAAYSQTWTAADVGLGNPLQQTQAPANTVKSFRGQLYEMMVFRIALGANTTPTLTDLCRTLKTKWKISSPA